MIASLDCDYLKKKILASKQHTETFYWKSRERQWTEEVKRMKEQMKGLESFNKVL
jgi:hypothetical protein